VPDSFADICICGQQDWLYGLCLRLEHKRLDADDLFQDTWLKALERFDTFDTNRQIRPWLARICVNTYRDGLRRTRRRLLQAYRPASGIEDRDILQDLPSGKPGPEAQAVDNEFKLALAACLDTLDDKYRLPLILQYYSGIGYDDISRLLNLNQGTVKSRLNEAKKRLRRQMEASGYARQD
jgi:RNA polymerase sigma-70 factor, ECF subfamily